MSYSRGPLLKKDDIELMLVSFIKLSIGISNSYEAKEICDLQVVMSFNIVNIAYTYLTNW